MTNNNHQPPARHALVLLAGLPGAGKTTFALQVAPLLDAVHLESDAIRAELFPVRTYTEREHAAVFAELERRAADALARGQSVVVDATNLREPHRRRFPLIAEQLGVPAVMVRLTAPEEEIRSRLEGPRAGASEATAEIYERLRERVDPFRAPCVTIDTRYAPGASIDFILALLEAKS